MTLDCQTNKIVEEVALLCQISSNTKSQHLITCNVCESYAGILAPEELSRGTDVEEQILVVHIAIGACLLKLKSAQTSLSNEQEKEQQHFLCVMNERKLHSTGLQQLNIETGKIITE
ncbi:hypothetical protein SADUNF_SadunfUnG0011200 [Salix dunnii]|uniref:Uncharacterized protein n=1 Tax=Salix dunnii TaxID=1413687 RepID=A0A835J202_9ROSI|nr:hypothetical protein SADUNF_SadunfUnG0011200 [Salix dunnii]